MPLPKKNRLYRMSALEAARLPNREPIRLIFGQEVVKIERTAAKGGLFFQMSGLLSLKNNSTPSRVCCTQGRTVL
jgi:hypothetical protein